MMDLTNSQESGVSILKDPFNIDCVKDICIRMYVNYNKEKMWYAKVEFQNGSTEGAQRFNDNADFRVIVAQVEEFLKSIKK